jgi:hypothetical protein
MEAVVSLGILSLRLIKNLVNELSGRLHQVEVTQTEARIDAVFPVPCLVAPGQLFPCPAAPVAKKRLTVDSGVGFKYTEY